MPKERVEREFRLQEVPPIESRYNIAPTQDILAIRQAEDEREAVMLRWGLVPSWAKDASVGTKLINARSETVMEKPSFHEAFKRRRTIIPADGFYEWSRNGSKKQPFYFQMRDERPFGFAGMWDRWRSDNGEVIESCTILTIKANELLRQIHDRMPVIIHPEDYEVWLAEDMRKSEILQELLRPYASEEMAAFPVTALINNVRNQGPKLVEQASLSPS